MATEDIKVVDLPQDSFQKVDEDNNYVIRFRILNEDGSQRSSWTPYLKIAAKQITGTPIPSASISISQSDGIVSIQWVATETSYRPLYDVFIRYGTTTDLSSATYEFIDTVSAPFATAVDPGGAITHAQVKIQVAGFKQEINNNLLLGESSVASI